MHMSMVTFNASNHLFKHLFEVVEGPYVVTLLHRTPYSGVWQQWTSK